MDHDEPRFDGVIDFSGAVADQFDPLYMIPPTTAATTYIPTMRVMRAMANAINLAMLQ